MQSASRRIFFTVEDQRKALKTNWNKNAPLDQEDVDASISTSGSSFLAIEDD